MVRRAAKRNHAAPHFYVRYFGHTKLSTIWLVLITITADLKSILRGILFYKCSTFFRFLVQMHLPIFFKLKFYLTSPVPNCHYRCNTFIRKGCNRFKILLQFQIFSVKSNENMVWACHLPKHWECPTIFGRKFLERR